MKRTSAVVQEEINKLTRELEQLKQKEASIRALPLTQRLAVVMHDHQCTWNHTDGCGWHYEVVNNVHDFRGSAHKPWLEVAERVVKRLEGILGSELAGDDNIIELVEAVILK